MDRGAWRATVHGVAKGRTQLKRLGTHVHQPESKEQGTEYAPGRPWVVVTKEAWL